MRSSHFWRKPRFTPNVGNHNDPTPAHHHASADTWPGETSEKNQIFVKSDYYSAIAQGIARRLFTEDDYFIKVALRC